MCRRWKAATVESWSQVKQSFSSSLEKLKSGVENLRKHTAWLRCCLRFVNRAVAYRR